MSEAAPDFFSNIPAQIKSVLVYFDSRTSQAWLKPSLYKIQLHFKPIRRSGSCTAAELERVFGVRNLHPALFAAGQIRCTEISL